MSRDDVKGIVRHPTPTSAPSAKDGAPSSAERISQILAALPVGISPDLRNDLEYVRDAEAQMPEGWLLNRIVGLVNFHVAPKAEEPWRERVHAIARGEEIHA